MRTAEETSRAGIAQVEASYRAALDAVRAEAANAHSQWRRGLRRDAYSALLLASHQVRSAGLLLTSGSIEDRMTRGVLTTQRAALTKAQMVTQEAAIVVALEGPDEPAAKAEALVYHCRRFGDVREHRAAAEEAEHNIRAARTRLDADDPLSEFVQAVDLVMAHILVYLHGPDALATELLVRTDPSEIRDLYDAAIRKLMHIPESFREDGWAFLNAKLGHPDQVRDQWRALDQLLLEAHEDFLTAARAVLDGDGPSQ